MVAILRTGGEPLITCRLVGRLRVSRVSRASRVIEGSDHCMGRTDFHNQRPVATRTSPAAPRASHRDIPGGWASGWGGVGSAASPALGAAFVGGYPAGQVDKRVGGADRTPIARVKLLTIQTQPRAAKLHASSLWDEARHSPGRRWYSPRPRLGDYNPFHA